MGASTLMAEELLQGRYRVLRALGGGAQGRVYQVLDLATDTERALKIVGPDRSGDLVAEFGAFVRIDHPNVARAIDLEILTRACGEHPAGSAFFTAELVRGSSVSQALPPEVGERNEWLRRTMSGALAGLAALHDSALVHADIKPANVLVQPDGRVVLVDFGLSESPAPVRGTLPFMAPEVLAGELVAASDLYSLGATLWTVIAGRPPYEGDTLADTARRICAAERPVLSQLAPWLDPKIEQVIDALLDPDPARRPGSATAVHAALAAIADRRESELGRPPLVGMDDLAGELAARLAELARGRLAAVVVRGAAGSGRTTLMQLAKHRYQLGAIAGRSAPATFVEAKLDELGAAEAESRLSIADRLARAALARDRAAIWVVDAPTEERARALVRAVCADEELDAPPLFTSSEDDALEPSARVAIVDLAPLADDVAAGLARRHNAALSPDEVERVVAAAGGNPGMIAALSRSTEGVDGSGGYRALVARQLAGLSAISAELVALLAAALSPLPADQAAQLLAVDIGATWRAAAELLAGGWLRRGPAGFELSSGSRAQAVCSSLPPGVLSMAHRRLWSSGAGTGWRRARYGIGAEQPEAVPLVLDAADELGALGRREDAFELLVDALSLATDDARPPIAAAAAALAVMLGHYEQATALARQGLDVARTASERHRLLRIEADAVARSGERERACELLRTALEVVADRDTKARLARLLVDRGEYREALALAGDDASGSAAEAAGLAHFYLGQVDTATQHFRAAERAAREESDERLLARALSLQGMAAQAGGDIVTAASLYDRAAAGARAAGDVHAGAVYLLNRAAADFERGRFASAMDSAERARGRFARLGDVAELAAANYNLGLAALALADVELARDCAQRAVRIAQRHRNAQMEAYGLVLEGDVDRRVGQLASAEALYREAVSAAERAQLARDARSARRNLAELLAEAGSDEAWTLLDSLEAADGSQDEAERAQLTRARVALALDPARAPAASALADTAERARDSGRDDLAWRAQLLAARIAAGAGDMSGAARHAKRAEEIAAELAVHQPRLARAGLESDPDHRALRALLEQTSTPLASDRVGDAEVERLRRLLSVSRRLNSELRLQPLLDLVLDTALDLVRAERGMLVLRERTGRLEVVAARGGGSLADHPAEGGAQLSRAIVDRAIERGEVVLTAHAGSDARFDSSASVAAMGLRSVLAVPLRDKSDIIGSVVLDHRFRRGAFDDSAVETVRDLANIAGVAIANARLAQMGQEHRREIDELNRRLQREVDNTRGELDAALAKLATESERRLRHDYDAIVGRSPKMLELLRLVDRATDADLPVVIVGESGTGKELIARALHTNGKRGQGPFVAVNCGALPEPLLESELFGHARGAFTGAQRDRRGVFEVADGGTLFLDELADTSLAMQAKLLRVLQEGELRRVGDDRARKVDVRVVAALNRPLEALVKTGHFREDLYYRLNVLQVVVPPLRERLEDIPALCSHVLGRLGDTSLAREALELMVRYDWPGNVRELENELTRAATMASKGVITTEDLSPRLVDFARASASSPRELDLKSRVEALERTLLGRALREAGGNQSQAARLLGLSRYGLQKKLKRYQIDVQSPDDGS